MALTQMQIIQSLGEAMAWFERELQWGVPPTELRHLSGRIGELYAALITNGQMATEVNQKGYDVVSSIGERVSVKTTAMMGSSGHISFNANTLEKVDRIIVLRINTEEMQIETLLNETTENAKALMSKTSVNNKYSIVLSKLLNTPKVRSNISVIKSVRCENYIINELENGTIEVLLNGELISPVKPILRELAAKFNIAILNNSGNPHNTRQLGSLLINALKSLNDSDYAKWVAKANGYMIPIDKIQTLYDRYFELIKFEIDVFGVKATEVRHLIGRLGEFYCALYVNGKLAHTPNQHGFDVISSEGKKISVKTTAQRTGFVAISSSTVHLVDNLMIIQYSNGDLQILYYGSIGKAIEAARFYQPTGNYELDISKARKLISETMNNGHFERSEKSN